MPRSLVYAVIPARGGSKGLRGKNLRLLHGQPLISYIIRAALQAQTIDRVFVSTENDEIARVAMRYGAKVIRHPKSLSTSTTSTFGVIRRAAKIFKKKWRRPDVLVTMRATSPLCEPTDVDNAVRLLFRKNADSVVSVAKSDVHPLRMLRKNRKKELEHFDKRSSERNFPHRRQSFGDVYIRNGAIYATRTEVIERGSLWGKHCVPYVMPKERSVNINDWIDFLLAESLLKQRVKPLS